MPSLPCRPLAAALLFAGPAITGQAFLQQRSLVDVHDSLLHAEIAALGAYPELCEMCSEAVLSEVPRRTCSNTYATFDGVGVRATLVSQRDVLTEFHLSVDDSTWVLPATEFEGLATTAYCAFDSDSQRTMPYCSVARSVDGARVYVHLLVEGPRERRLLTWVFEEGRYLMRVDEEAVL